MVQTSIYYSKNKMINDIILNKKIKLIVALQLRKLYELLFRR